MLQGEAIEDGVTFGRPPPPPPTPEIVPPERPREVGSAIAGFEKIGFVIAGIMAVTFTLLIVASN